MKKNNTGDYSYGRGSTGDQSTGDFSTGDHSTGFRSTGQFSAAEYSTGNYSTGECSSGNCSTGYASTGDRSTGDFSTGHWSTGKYSTGYFSVTEGQFSMFDKPCTVQEVNCEKPEWLFFDLTEWIDEDDMTNEEKAAHPLYEITGGYLKVYDYQQAARKSWVETTLEDKKATLNLPNYDDSIMQQIFGFSPQNELRRIALENKPLSIEERLTKLEKAINEKR